MIVRNFHLDVIAADRETFDLALKIAFTRKAKAVGFAKTPKRGMIMFWEKPKNLSMPDVDGDGQQIQFVELPYEMDLETSISWVWGWLQSPQTEYGPPPAGMDNAAADYKRGGFRIYTDAFGGVAGLQAAFVAILPTYVMVPRER